MTRMWKIIGVLLAVFVVGALATPKLLSTDYVKQRIASQLSSVTGRTVVLNGDSAIGLYPYLSVTYQDVSIGDTSANTEPIVRMDALRAKLSLAAAFWGSARLAELSFIRPIINLKVDKTGAENWRISKGPLAERLATPEGKRPEKLALGSISIEQGIVKFNSEPLRRTEQLTDFNGTLNWPSISASANLTASAVWRGEVVSINALTTAPFALIRGGESKLSTKVESKPLTLDFEGVINLYGRTAGGSINLATPSTERISTWLKRPLEALALLGGVELQGDVLVSAQKTEFSNMAISSGGHTGVGRLLLEMTTTDEPRLSGTLAFDTFAFPTHALVSSSENTDQTARAKNILKNYKGYELDLRLSANRAQLGAHELSNVAASVLVKDGNANVDIGQADVFGGTISASFSLNDTNKIPTYATSLDLVGANFEQLAAVHGTSSYFLTGVGDVKLNLKSTGNSLPEIMLRLNGDAELKSNDGVLNGINLADVISAQPDNSDQIWQSVSGSSPYQTLKLSVSVANGIALFSDSTLVTDTFEASLFGKSDLAERSLALRGRIAAKNSQGAEAKILPFFIGGTTAAPLFVPLFGRSKAATTPKAEE